MDGGWGKLNSGAPFAALALDLDRAFALARFGGWEDVVLQYVREQSWTRTVRERKRRGEPWPDPEPCLVPVRALGRAVQCHHQTIVRAVRKLVACGVLIPFADGRVTINKRADEWTDDAGLPRFSATQIRYLREGLPRDLGDDMTEKAEAPALPLIPAPGSASASTPEAPALPRGSASASTPEAPALPPPVPPLTPPYATRPRQKISEEKKIPEERRALFAHAHASGDADLPFDANPGTDFVSRQSRIDELVRAVEGRTMPASEGGGSVGDWIQNQLMRADRRAPTLDELEALVFAKILPSPRPIGAGLLMKIVRDWRDVPGTMPRVDSAPARAADPSAPGVVPLAVKNTEPPLSFAQQRRRAWVEKARATSYGEAKA